MKSARNTKYVDKEFFPHVLISLRQNINNVPFGCSMHRVKCIKIMAQKTDKGK